GPLEVDEALPPRGPPGANPLELGAEARAHISRDLLDAARLTDREDVLEDSLDGRAGRRDDGRPRRQPGRERADRLLRDGADIALGLRHDDGHPESLERRPVHAVEILAAIAQLPHLAVDLRGRGPGIDARGSDALPPAHGLVRVVALVRDRDHVPGEAELGEPLGARREERRDPHQPALTIASTFGIAMFQSMLPFCVIVRKLFSQKRRRIGAKTAGRTWA